MQQIKHHNNVIMSMSRRQNKQIKPVETDAARHKTYHSC